MQYRKFGKTNEMISNLGFGCMRLPLLPGGDGSKIDEEQSIHLIRYAIDQGVNYIDTAYPYHGDGMGLKGESEPFVAKVLSDGYRQKVKLATKLPTWLIKTREDMDLYLNEQLERLNTDCIDFYLLHALDKNVWKTLVELNVKDFLDSAISDGRIKYAGFSFHDEYPLFEEIVDYYDWTFCQIQLNYMDIDFQAGLKGLHYAAERNLGIVIMEPLRGGKLAVNLPDSVQELFQKEIPVKSGAEWALRWIWNYPEVSVVLSGMNSMDQVQENIQIANEIVPSSLSKKELKIIEMARDAFIKRTKVNCTGCAYCMPCPAGVNIPKCFSCYNTYGAFGNDGGYSLLSDDEKADSCVSCGKCETHCPQGIPIRKVLKKLGVELSSI